MSFLFTRRYILCAFCLVGIGVFAEDTPEQFPPVTETPDLTIVSDIPSTSPSVIEKTLETADSKTAAVVDAVTISEEKPIDSVSSVSSDLFPDDLLSIQPLVADNEKPSETSLSEEKPANATVGAIQETLAAKKTEEQKSPVASVSVPLQGLFFMENPNDIKEMDTRDLKGIQTYKLFIPDEAAFNTKMSAFIDQPLSVKLLQEIQITLAKYYQDQGYPIVGVTIPTGQDVSHGVVAVVVVIGKLEDVKVEGGKYYSNSTYAKRITTQKDQYIRSKPMLEDLYWLNNSAFYSTDLFYTKGSTFGTTNVELQVKERLPIRVYTGYDDTGNLVAGPTRWFVGMNFGYLGFPGHELNYQWMTADHVHHWNGHSASYILPLPWRNFFKVFGSYTTTNPASLPTEFSQSGYSWTVDGKYVFPYIDSWNNHHNFSLGYVFKRTNNYLTFVTTVFNNTTFDVSQFYFDYDGLYLDRLGANTLRATMYYSPGHMTAYNKTHDFAKERPGIHCTYLYGKIQYNRTTIMKYDFTWFIDVETQIAPYRLLPSEQFSIGGFLTVRGYNENQLIGDWGWLIKNELRTPPVSLIFRDQKFWGKKDQLQFLAFVDIGLVADLDPNILLRSTRDLSSLGLGMRYNFRDNIAVRLDYGWQLKHLQGLTPRSRMHLGATLAF